MKTSTPHNNTSLVYDDVSIAPSAQIGLHTQPTWELSLVLVGRGTRTIGSTSEPFSANEVVLVPPGIPHRWQFDETATDASGKISNIAIMFSTAMLDAMAEQFAETAGMAAAIKSLTHAVVYRKPQAKTMARLMRAMRGADAPGRLLLMFRLLTLAADTCGGHDAGHDTSLRATERRLADIEIYCKCNFARRITLADAAAHAGMNKSAFCTFLRKHKGQTFTEYLNAMRLDKAAELLRDTDRSIADAAYSSGFASIPYFNKLFRMRYGMAPRTFRES